MRHDTAKVKRLHARRRAERPHLGSGLAGAAFILNSMSLTFFGADLSRIDDPAA
jgi:hypothetical protein